MSDVQPPYKKPKLVDTYILDVGGWNQKNVLMSNLIWCQKVSSTSTQVDSVGGIKLTRIEANETETENFDGLGTINHNGSGYVLHSAPAVVPNNSTISEFRDGDRNGNGHIVDLVENNGLTVKSIRCCVGDSQGKNRPPLNMIERPKDSFIVTMSNGASSDCAVIKKESANVYSVKTDANRLSMAKNVIPAITYKTELDTGVENNGDFVVKNETDNCNEPDVCSKPDECSKPDNCSKPVDCSTSVNCSKPDSCSRPVQSKIAVDQRAVRLRKFITNRQNIRSAFLPKIDDLLFQPSIGSMDRQEPTKNDVLRMKLLVLLHAFCCERLTDCKVSKCSEMKIYWNHLVKCLNNSACEDRRCKTSRQVLDHWMSCQSTGCEVCLPLRGKLITPNVSANTTCDRLQQNQSHSESSAVGRPTLPSGPRPSPPTRSGTCDESNRLQVTSQITPICKKVWSQTELRHSLTPLLEMLFRHTKEVGPFMQPVDPFLHGCPDYFDIIANPMDFGTIQQKLKTGVYKDPWEFVDDVYLVFGNAWLYNKRCSIFHKFACKLADIFEANVDDVMQRLGYCCGQRYEFTPLPRYCDSQSWCNIPVLVEYYAYEEYAFCEHCFTESIHAPTISAYKELGAPPVVLEKHLFTKKKNFDRKLERFTMCIYCGRKNHTICVQHLDEICPNGFVCKGCLSLGQIERKIKQYKAKDIPQTELSKFLEDRVQGFLKRRKFDSGQVWIRMIASSKETTVVKPKFHKHFPNMAVSFPYIAKAIFAFQEIDGVDVCFFGMHVQEYGSDAAPPNSRRSYLAYLDSVQYFQPQEYRTTLYHEILLGYMEYIKSKGFISLHIWSCPPSEGDDYIFNCHPPKQKIPKAKRLQEWYRKLMEKATNENIVTSYTDILSYAVGNGLNSAADMPYFEGDFWPTSLEDNIKALEKTEAAGDKNTSGKPSKAKSSKDSKSKKGQKGQSNKGKKITNSTHGDALVDKIYSTLGKYREMFFVVQFYTEQELLSLNPTIVDPDPVMPNDLMHERSTFLIVSRERQAEFSTIRRAKHSTIVMLYEILNHSQQQQQQVSALSCQCCRMSNMETYFACKQCSKWILCAGCYQTIGHEHETEKIDNASMLAIKSEVNERAVKSGVQMLEHATHCDDATCSEPRCDKLKVAIIHVRGCPKRILGCTSCHTIARLCLLHARHCQETTDCKVLFCQEAKRKLLQQTSKQRQLEKRMLMRRTAAMHRMEANENDESGARYASGARFASEASNLDRISSPPSDERVGRNYARGDEIPSPSRGKDVLLGRQSQ